MATFGTEGLEDIEKLLLDMDKTATAAIPKMITAAAEVIVAAQKAEAAAMGIQESGGFINSIKPTKVKGDTAEKHLLIYPQGKAPHGSDYGGGKSQSGDVRYATIGFMNEAGTSKQAPRTWFSTANSKAGDAANAKMAEVWESMKNNG